MALKGVGVAVVDRTGVGSARRAATATAREIGLDREASGRAAIVAVELAANALKHGGGGWCFVSPTEFGGGPAVSIVATDTGGGIADPGAAYTDGYSTTDTPGTGLGAVRRLSLAFDLYSQPGRGVVAAARVGRRPASGQLPADPGEVSALDGGGLVRAKVGQEVSGDAWALRRSGRVARAMLVDGLGHGPGAAEAAAAAVAAFEGARSRGAGPLAREVDLGLRGTRGAAIAVAVLDAGTERLDYAGIGNITGRMVLPEGVRSLVSVNGTAGVQARSLREFEYDAPAGSVLVLHSDGVSARWSLDGYPGLRERSPEVIAGLLIRDFGRDRDDAAVLVLRADAYLHPEGSRT